MTREVRRTEEPSQARLAIDPFDKLPQVIFVPDDAPNHHANTEQYLVVDLTYGGAGLATVVQTPANERYLTKLEIGDKDPDRQVRMAAYLLAIEDTTLRRGEVFINDPLAERPDDVEIWQTLRQTGAVVVDRDFESRNPSRKDGAGDLYVGRMRILPPEITTSTDSA